MTERANPAIIGPDYRCDECGRRAREARLAPGHWYEDHSGTCSRNGALQVCERCDQRHADLDFGQALACIMDVPLAEGREMQQRIANRVERGLLGDENGSDHSTEDRP